MQGKLIGNYTNQEKSFTVMKYSDQIFHVECRVNGHLVKEIPFLTESDATSFASTQIGTSGKLYLAESN
jgi:hypothetical protein